ncbi:MAG: HAMP domain-containing histidine kinase [Chitinophagaceae bacterium]|nr:HAMP domain-containing histidine kinase [Oligoflexus sp.]
MLYKFLLENAEEILALTKDKTRDLAEGAPSSEQLEKGLPIFYKQLIAVLKYDHVEKPNATLDKRGMAQAARDADEPALALAAGSPNEAELARSAGEHGSELLRLGYTLSHVVHAYGAMCQSINEIAATKKLQIAPEEFRNLNQCLDVAIAGAVTEFQSQRDIKKSKHEIEKLGFLAHELRNSLSAVSMAFMMIKEGAVTATGSTGQLLERSIARLNELISRSLTEVRLRSDPKLHIESDYVQQLVDQIALTAKIDASSRNQALTIKIEPNLKIEADQQLIHSALFNLIQNALKYTRKGGEIKVRGKLVDDTVVIEVEDECGGLSPEAENGLFKKFEQNHENRSGMGIGLTIAQEAIILNHGTIECQNLPGKGCIFRVSLPKIKE